MTNEQRAEEIQEMNDWNASFAPTSPPPPSQSDMLRRFKNNMRRDPASPTVHVRNLIWTWQNAGYDLITLSACITLPLDQIVDIAERQLCANSPFVEMPS